ncbi:MAG: hypothetical protein E2O68_02780 [Deltaproteobacteria bacterium]|nr:MAG: hypothetical protein E2O68_02780 [Deltaproteobacteria bacterium]
MAAVLFKALTFYFFFIVARGVYRTFKSVKNVHEAASGTQKKSKVKRKPDEEVIEAEFRHLD